MKDVTSESFQNMQVVPVDEMEQSGNNLTEQSETIETVSTETQSQETTQQNSQENNTSSEQQTETKEATAQTSEKVEPTFFQKLQGKEAETSETAVVDWEAKSKQLEQELLSTKDRVKFFEDSPIAQMAKLANGEYDLTKVDLKALAKEMAGEDFSKYDIEALLKMDLKAKYPGMSDDKIEIGVQEKLEKMSDWEKEAEREAISSRLSSSQNPHDVLKRLEEVKSAQLEDANQPSFEQQVNQRRDEAINRFTEFGGNLEGQVYQGYTATKEDALAIVEAFKQDTLQFDEGKKYFDYFKAVTYDKAVEEADKRGYERGLKEKTNANVVVSPSGVIVSKAEKTGLGNANADSFRNAQQVN